MTDDPAIIEAAAKVIYANGYDEEYSEHHYMTARAVLRKVTPLIEKAALERAAFFDSNKYVRPVLDSATSLIRAAALEEAAKVAEGIRYEGYQPDPYADGYEDGAARAADKIRALKEQP